MWIFLSDAFLSIVDKGGVPSSFLTSEELAHKRENRHGVLDQLAGQIQKNWV